MCACKCMTELIFIDWFCDTSMSVHAVIITIEIKISFWFTNLIIGALTSHMCL